MLLLRLRQKLAWYLLVKIKLATRDKKPDVIVGDNYLRRWHLIPENRFLNIYYHELRASDLDRHLHDHPYFFSSFVLEGGYIEYTNKGTVDRSAGSLNFHQPWYVHRLVMKDRNGANTIFITLPKIRKWGFRTEDGWVPNDEYLNLHGIQGEFAQPTVFGAENEGKQT